MRESETACVRVRLRVCDGEGVLNDAFLLYISLTSSTRVYIVNHINAVIVDYS